MKDLIIIISSILAIMISLSLMASDYTVGPGDVITVKVYKEKDFSGDFKVAGEGNLNYTAVGDIPVADKTEEEIRDKITEILSKDYLVNPKVSVSVKEYNSKKVLVVGSVQKPGMYPLKRKVNLLDVISMAGGLDKSGSTKVVVLRKTKFAVQESSKSIEKEVKEDIDKSLKSDESDSKKGKEPQAKEISKLIPIVIDYAKILKGGDISQNIEIKGGDVVNIPKANEVYVFGSVQKPGPVLYSDNMGVLQAVTLAGGPSPEASQSSTYILRVGEKGNEQRIKVNLSKVLKQKTKNVAVKPNDVIVVPESFF